MAEELVVADASTLIGLAAAGAFDLLRELFGQVAVSTRVRDEVLAGDDRPGVRELSRAIGDGWITVIPAEPSAAMAANLDVGEATTLTLAIEHSGSSLVLMDEAIGRSYARAWGLHVTGLVGVLLAAKREGLVPRVRPFLERLRKDSFRLSDEFVDTIIKEAGGILRQLNCRSGTAIQRTRRLISDRWALFLLAEAMESQQELAAEHNCGTS